MSSDTDEATAPGPDPAAPGPSDVTGPTAESHRREVSAGAHFPALDGYRAVAALMVVITHIAFSTGASATGAWGHTMARFDFGVPLFFLMSGFLLYRPWARAALEGRSRPNLRTYSIRRGARILPAYWAVVVVTLLLLPEIQPVPFDQWWRHMLAVQIYQPQGAIEGLSQTWSLCTEISFYVALPFLGALALGRRSRSPRSVWRRQMALLATLVVVATVFNVMKVNDIVLPLHAGYWLPAYLDWFAVGMGLALVEVRSRQPAPPSLVRGVLAAGREQVATLVIAVAVFAVAVTPVAGSYGFDPTGPWETLIKHWLYLGAATAFLIPGIFGGDRGVPALLSRPLPHRLGLISYGIFLWHLPILRWLMPAMGIPYFTGRGILVALVVIPVSVGVAAVSYAVVERPAQRYAHRF